MPHYHFNAFQNDCLAGLTVAVILIPQAMAYAMLAGLPPVTGLYAAVITPAVGGLWGSLRQLATGPIAITSLLVLTTLSAVAEPGSAQYIPLAMSLALVTGGIYLAIGFLGLGRIMAFISHSAVTGFTAAAALIIIGTQLPHLLGIPAPRHDSVIFMFIEIASRLASAHPAACGIGVLSFAFIYTVKKLRPAFPAGLAALTVSTLAVVFFDLEVAVVGQSPAGLPKFAPPDMNPEMLIRLSGPALVIALVSFAETYSVGRAIASETRQKLDVNQEFIGQGLANVAAAFFQGYPVSGSFSRSAVNFAAGAQTAVAGVIASLVAALTLVFFTPLLTHVPKAGLAAVVIGAVLTLFHPGRVFHLWKMNRDDGITALTVFGLALVIQPDEALLVGVLASLFFFLWKTMHPRIVEITKDPEFNIFVNADETGKPGCPQILQLRSDNVIMFANAEYTVDHILERVEAVSTPLKFVLEDFQAVGFIDITGIDELRRLKSALAEKNIRLALFDVHLPVMNTFASSGFRDDMKADGMIEAFGLTSQKGKPLAELFARIDHVYCRRVCPYTLFYECKTVKD
jgi:SulP family sulfate permease